MASTDLGDFDFGFTAVDEQELEAVSTASDKVAATTETAKAAQKKLDSMYNLQRNPEKEYIFWPDRHSKVEAFRDKLTILYKS